MSTVKKSSSRFNMDSGGDVIFSSSDRVLFYVHKKNLEFCSSGFPPADTPTLAEIIPLPEKASTLELLFPFVYPQRHPGLNDMMFEELLELAEVAEKYGVYFAMSLCVLKMKDYASDNAPKIFGFAAKHDYPFLISMVAPLLINKPLTEVVNVIPGYMYIPWTLYKERWQLCLDNVCSNISGNSGNRKAELRLFVSEVSKVHSPEWYQRVSEVQQIFRKDISKLYRCGDVFTLFEGKHCNNHGCVGTFERWRDRAIAEVARVPDFVAFLKEYTPAQIKGK